MSVLTFYPDADKINSVDGTVGMESGAGEIAGSVWNDLRTGAGNYHQDTTPEYNAWYMREAVNIDRWWWLMRSIFTFNIKELQRLGASRILSAIFSIWGTEKEDQDGWLPNMNVCFTGTGPASDNDLINADFGSLGVPPNVVEYCDEPISYANMVVNGWNSFFLNAAGLAHLESALAGDGIVKLCVRNVKYDGDSSAINPISDGGQNYAFLRIYFSNQMAYQPKLTITYAKWHKLSISGLYIPYEDQDKSKELHVVLKNLSPTTKRAGDTGGVKIDVGYEPSF